MREIVVVAPHPDDETLGCGGSLLKHKAQGDKIHWLIITGITEEAGFATERVRAENEAMASITQRYEFHSTYSLRLPSTQLDILPVVDLVEKIGQVFHEIKPEIVYLPYPGDVHSDHKVVFDAVVSCSKWFRYPTIKRVLCYETLSETDFGLNPDITGFRPNVFIDISDYLERKIELLQVYASELGDFPFPRSELAIRGLAIVRGAAAGCQAAEGFMLLKEII